MSRDEILLAIEGERERQKKEGYADSLEVLEWLAVISEESGELAQAGLDYHRRTTSKGLVSGPRRRTAMIEEAVQVAAACVAFLEDWS